MQMKLTEYLHIFDCTDSKLFFLVIFDLAIKSEGGPIARVSEVKASFRKFSPMRPIIMRLADHLKVSVDCVFCTCYRHSANILFHLIL